MEDFHMKRDFTALSSTPLKLNATFVHPPVPPELIHLDSPSVTVMTDFKFVHPVTVNPETGMDDALGIMKTAGVRLLLVTNRLNEVVGIITANDIMGERPIKILGETRVTRADIKVSTIMTAQPDIPVLDMMSVCNAQVGHIIETLHQLERQHVLVVEADRETKAQRIVGMFSTSQISKLLGRNVRDEVIPAHSLAEIVRQIG
jgi:CBS domain-containing protein